MNKFLGVAGRVLLAQLFLVQVVILIYGFLNNPSGYQDYQAGLGQHGLPGIFAPLIILIQVLGGAFLLIGYKTKATAIFMAIYAVFIAFTLGLAPLQYLAVVGGLLTLANNPRTAFSVDGLRNR